MIDDTKQRHLGIDLKSSGICRNVEMEWSLFAASDNTTEIRAAGGINRHRRDEAPWHSRLKQLALDSEAFFRAFGAVLDSVMRDAGSANPIFDEPFHGMISVQIHCGSHDGVQLAL